MTRNEWGNVLAVLLATVFFAGLLLLIIRWVP
jgi:type II secretory pathway component PulJ